MFSTPDYVPFRGGSGSGIVRSGTHRAEASRKACTAARAAGRRARNSIAICAPVPIASCSLQQNTCLLTIGLHFEHERYKDRIT